MFSLIVALDSKYGIGKNNDLPWKLKKDMDYFRMMTTTTNTENVNKMNAVIMGRNTWESIPKKFRPLKNRFNIVISSTLNDSNYENTKFFKNLPEVIKYIQNNTNQNIKNSFIIGGSSIYQEFLDNHLDKLSNLYITQVYDNFDCDRVFLTKEKYNEIIQNYDLFSCSDFISETCPLNNKIIYYRFLRYQVKGFDIESNIPMFENIEENQYLNLLEKITSQGIQRGDRTGTGTLSVFGETQKFNLRDTFPLLTTKRMFLRGIFEELMLYLRGQTDNKILNSKNINIWNGNTSREFLDQRGLNKYEEGDMGETYGFNFRHFGGEYKGCQYEYGADNGFDQLNNAINLIKNNPESRRIIISLWNPKTNHKAALPSCLCWYQFYVNTQANELNLLINIRSSDFFLANNWNVCTGALLVHLICSLDGIDLSPGDLTVISGDTHIYNTHMEQVKINMERKPRPFPKLLIKNRKTKIEDFEYEDLRLIGYNPYPGISAPMAV
jgi:dihydrofolate reductase/thymidylate synthase